MKTSQWAVILITLIFGLLYPLVVRGADVGVVNGGFEADPENTIQPTGWTLSTDNGGSVATTAVHSGSQSLMCSNGPETEYYQAIDVTLYAGQTITVSGWMYTNEGTSGGIEAAISDSSTCNVSTSSRTLIGDAAEELAPRQWQLFQKPIPVPTTAPNQYLCIFLWADAPDLYMDDISATVSDLTAVGLNALGADHSWVKVAVLALAAALTSGALIAIRWWHHNREVRRRTGL